jgi:hypothetical protein
VVRIRAFDGEIRHQVALRVDVLAVKSLEESVVGRGVDEVPEHEEDVAEFLSKPAQQTYERFVVSLKEVTERGLGVLEERYSPRLYIEAVLEERYSPRLYVEAVLEERYSPRLYIEAVLYLHPVAHARRR